MFFLPKIYMNPFLEKLLGNEPEEPQHPKQHSPGDFIVGKIYATWCGHCVALEPKWKKMTNQLHKQKKVTIVEIESETMESDLAVLNNTHLPNSDQKVELNGGYPTIFKIVDGKISYYEGPREVNPMLKWALEGMKSKKHSMTQKRKKHSRTQKRKKHYRSHRKK